MLSHPLLCRQSSMFASDTTPHLGYIDFFCLLPGLRPFFCSCQGLCRQPTQNEASRTLSCVVFDCGSRRVGVFLAVAFDVAGRRRQVLNARHMSNFCAVHVFTTERPRCTRHPAKRHNGRRIPGFFRALRRNHGETSCRRGTYAHKAMKTRVSQKARSLSHLQRRGTVLVAPVKELKMKFSCLSYYLLTLFWQP